MGIGTLPRGRRVALRAVPPRRRQFRKRREMMSKRRLWPLAAIALVAALAAATTASARLDAKHASKVKVGGTLVFAAEQNPDCLNLQLNPCNAAWAQWMETPVSR